MVGEVSQEDSSKSTRSPVRVPRELIREILRSLYNDSDKWTLETCALVSQDWLHESRHFLFRHIDISDSSDQDLADRFLDDILHSERLRPWLPSIHHLSFCRTIEDHEAFIIDISERLSNLRTLTWRLDNYGHPFRTEVFNAFSRFTRLHHLELVSCVFDSFEDFKKVLVALPVLSSLTLHRAMWYDTFQTTDLSEAPPPSAPGETRPALSKISVSAVHARSKYTSDVLLWLATTPTRHLLQELSIDIIHITAALRLIAGRPEPLAALDMQFWDEPDTHIFSSEDDNAQAAELRALFSQVGTIELLRLHLTYRNWDFHSVSWDSVARVLRAFASAPVSSSIRRIRLSCSRHATYLPQGDPSEQGTLQDLSQLDQALASASSGEHGFPALRTVEFATYHPDASWEAMLKEHYALHSEWVRSMLPRLHERGIAEVYVYGDHWVFGPGGLDRHACGPDFPHAYYPQGEEPV